MKNKKTIKKIIIGLAVAVVLLIGYSILSGNQNSPSSNGDTLSSMTGIGSLGQVQNTDVSLANSEILKILGNIQTITLNDDLFSNPVFRTLQDSRFIILKPSRVGRPNPFLPIGFDAVTSVTTPPLSSEDFGTLTEDTGPLPESLPDSGQEEL